MNTKSPTNIIDNNPYRILGIFANSSKKEEIANKGKMQALIRVGREVTFPIDGYTNCLSPITRTLETISNAESSISLADDRIKHAQFWFVKNHPVDDIAFNNILSGNFEVAVELWQKTNNMTSLQNCGVVRLLQSKVAEAINLYFAPLYKNYSQEFAKLFDENSTRTEEELIDSFLSQISNHINLSDILSGITSTLWRKKTEKMLVGPLESAIENVVAVAKKSKGKSATERYNAGNKLIKDCKIPLEKLKSVVGSTSAIYARSADKVAQEILQCGIDYFNASKPEIAAHKALAMQNAALNFAMGSMAKQRCQENVDILKKTIAILPPEGLVSNVNYIISLIEKHEKAKDGTFSSSSFYFLDDDDDYSTIFNPSSRGIVEASNLLREARSTLISMKNQTSSTNEWYLRMSTKVVSNCMSWIIEDVNKAQDKFVRFMQFNSYNTSACQDALTKLKNLINSADGVQNTIDGFDMESAYRSHYQKNRQTLLGIKRQLNGTSSGGSGGYSGGSNTSDSDDTNWGCIIFGVIAFIIFCMATCH